MTGLLIAWLGSLPFAIFAGRMWGRRSPGPAKHAHIWAPWEQIRVHDLSRGKERSGQRRDCLDCNYRELEFL